jgi:delta14-sterol reductase
MDFVAGFFAPWLIYLLITVFHLALPGKWYDGYVKDEETGELLRYRLNGWLVLIASVGLWAGLGYSGLVPYDWLYEHRWSGLAGACAFGLIYSAAMVLPAKPVKDSFFADFYLGRLLNPQLWGGRLDAKMWLYLIGAVMLELNVLSFTAAHVEAYPDNPNPGVFLCAGLLTYFVCDYLTFERVHVYTYDIFAERVGFKLGWGCLLFYPYFYAVGLWSVVDKPDPGYPVWALIIFALIFLSGWGMARGANMQKYFFKREPNRTFLGIEPKTVSDGERSLLASGFWGVSRHINYLGEILMATGIALSVCYPGTIWPWLYPVYYVVLLFPRQRDDDIRCAEKYGELWERYEEKVPYRIIPYIY